MKAGEFAVRLAVERTRMKLTQKDMAEFLGVSIRSLSSWESGEKLPKKTTRIHIADRLGYDADYFLTDEELNGSALDFRTNIADNTESYSMTDGKTANGYNGYNGCKEENFERFVSKLRNRVMNSDADDDTVNKCLESLEHMLSNMDKQ